MNPRGRASHFESAECQAAERRRTARQRAHWARPIAGKMPISERRLEGNLHHAKFWNPLISTSFFLDAMRLWVAALLLLCSVLPAGSYPNGAGSCAGPQAGPHGAAKPGSGGYELSASQLTVVAGPSGPPGSGPITVRVGGTVPFKGILIVASAGSFAGGNMAQLPPGCAGNVVAGPLAARKPGCGFCCWILL